MKRQVTILFQKKKKFPYQRDKSQMIMIFSRYLQNHCLFPIGTLLSFHLHKRLVLPVAAAVLVLENVVLVVFVVLDVVDIVVVFDVVLVVFLVQIVVFVVRLLVHAPQAELVLV